MMVFSRESFPKDRTLYWICWGAILLLVGPVPSFAIFDRLAIQRHVDEGHVLHQTIDAFNNRSLDVYWYGLPALPAYCAGATLLSYGRLYHHFDGHRFQKDLPHERDFPTSKSNTIYRTGRTNCRRPDSDIVHEHRERDSSGKFRGKIGQRSCRPHGDASSGGMSGARDRASIVIVDTFATFFVLVVLYICARIQAEASKPVWRDVALAGLAAGLAFASKYPAATVGMAVITTILILPVPWRRRLRLFFPAAGGFILGICWARR